MHAVEALQNVCFMLFLFFGFSLSSKARGAKMKFQQEKLYKNMKIKFFDQKL